MESSSSPPVVTRKMCKILRVVLLMIQNGVTKSKIMLDLHHLIMRRGKVVLKALNSMVIPIHHSAALTCGGCRSHDGMQASFVSPLEYEFSCSNSPAFQPYIPFHVGSSRRRGGRRPYSSSQNKHHLSRPANIYRDDEAALKDEVAEVSPLVGQARRLVRVTDSPFPLADDEKDKDGRVDKEAEEFIKMFYNQLRLQKSPLNFYFR